MKLLNCRAPFARAGHMHALDGEDGAAASTSTAAAQKSSDTAAIGRARQRMWRENVKAAAQNLVPLCSRCWCCSWRPALRVRADAATSLRTGPCGPSISGVMGGIGRMNVAEENKIIGILTKRELRDIIVNVLFGSCGAVVTGRVELRVLRQHESGLLIYL